MHKKIIFFFIFVSILYTLGLLFVFFPSPLTILKYTFIYSTFHYIFATNPIHFSFGQPLSQFLSTHLNDLTDYISIFFLKMFKPAWSILSHFTESITPNKIFFIYLLQIISNLVTLNILLFTTFIFIPIYCKTLNYVHHCWLQNSLFKF